MERLFAEQYKGKKVFVTGHSGFKGSWLTLWLKELGADVKGYSLEPDTKPNLFDALALSAQVNNVFADIRDYGRLQREMLEFEPEIIFHLAAQPLVRRSYRDPLKTIQTNALGTANLLESVRHTPSVRAVVSVTTDKCYENKETGQAYCETDPLGGYDPYSASKAMAEIVSASYRNSFFNPKDLGKTHRVALATARAGNVIGGGDWSEDRLVPDIVRAIEAGENISLRNPKAVRPWQHVLESLSGYLWLGARLLADPARFAGAWNFGPEDNQSATVEDLVKRFIEVFNKGRYRVEADPSKHEAGLLRLDITKAARELNWKPVWNLEETVRQTAEWYKAFNDGAVARELTLNQLKNYIEQAQKQLAPWSK